MDEICGFASISASSAPTPCVNHQVRRYITIADKHKPANLVQADGQNGRNRRVCTADGSKQRETALSGSKRFKASISKAGQSETSKLAVRFEPCAPKTRSFAFRHRADAFAPCPISSRKTNLHAIGAENGVFPQGITTSFALTKWGDMRNITIRACDSERQ